MWVWVLGVSSSDNHPPVLSLKNWSPRVRGLGITDASWRAIAFAIIGRRTRASLEWHRHRWSQGRMALLDTDRRRRDAVADGLTLRQDVIKKLITAIDDDGAGGFLARVLDDVTPILLRNGRLPVGQVCH